MRPARKLNAPCDEWIVQTDMSRPRFKDERQHIYGHRSFNARSQNWYAGCTGAAVVRSGAARPHPVATPHPQANAVLLGLRACYNSEQHNVGYLAAKGLKSAPEVRGTGGNN
jgi:hypothetical protein